MVTHALSTEQWDAIEKRPSWFTGIRWEMKLEKCLFVGNAELDKPAFA